MNKKIIIILFLVSTAVLATVRSSAMDYPHNDSNSVACEDCHYVWGSEPSLMIEGLSYGLNIDDTQYNALCWSCHENTTAPLVETHSSLQTDNGYGDWTVECIECHDVHGNYQFRTYGSPSYVFQGTVSSVNATTLTLTGAGWTVDQFKDLVLVPNIAWDYNNYRITGNTGDTLTVAGTIDLTQVSPGDTFAIIYGKLVRDTINTPNSGTKAVRFFNSTGNNSFADGDATYDGVCEVCHTQTTHHRNNVSGDHTHNAGIDCVTCHEHTKGFKPACDICHGNPPVVNTATGGPDGLANSPGSTGSTTAGAHDVHVNTKSFGCIVCHYDSVGMGATHNNGLTVTLGFYLFGGSYQGGSYDGQSGVSYNATTTAPVTSVSNGDNKICSNIYCHSTGQSTVSGSSSTPTYASPVWDDPASGACGTCHKVDEGAGLSSGSHEAHLGTTGVAGCAECHTGAENDASAYNSSNHINTTIEVANAYDSGGSPGNGYGKCSTGRCHDDGTGNPELTPYWGTPGGGCSECHVDVPATGSHVKHVITTQYNTADCGDCHDGAVRDTTAPAQHLDADIDVYDSSPGDLGYAQNVAKGGAPYDSCSTAYCHSPGQASDGGPSAPTYATVTWGDTAACGTCHEKNVGALTSGSHDEHLNATGVNGCGDCHTGAANDASSYNSANHVNQSINVANTYSAGGLPGNGYGECSAASCHEDGTGTLVDSPTWGTPVNDCSECHDTKPTTGGHTVHLMNPFNHGYNRPSCGDCHDGAVEGTTAPAQHIDGNLDVYDVNPGDLGYPQDEAKGGSPYNSCTTAYCHSSGQSYTDPNDPTPTYASPTWGNGEACGYCHKAETSHNVFAQTIDSGSHTNHLLYNFNLGGSTAMKCTICHKWEASQPFAACIQCHGTAGANTYHANGEINVFLDTEFGPRTAYGDQTGTPGNGYYSCSNTYCHSNATGGTGQTGDPRVVAINTSSDWGTAGPLSCDSCHDGPAAGPGYANGTPKANSHATHTASYSCDTCHDKTVDGANSIISTTWHVNSAYDVSGTPVDSYTYAADGGTCSAAACHGDGTPKWGGAVSCSDCHLGTGDVDDYTFNNATLAKIDTTEWTTQGHGKAGAPLPIDCAYCHDDGVAHDTATNPFRLANYNAGGNGWNDTCYVCHKTGSAGYDPGSGNKNSSVKIDKNHQMTAHGQSGNNGGKFCWDCHDPHGDGNIKMIQARPAKTTDGTYGIPSSTPGIDVVFTNNTTGTGAGGFARTGGSFEQGICNTCHTASASSPKMQHYTSTSSDSHNSGQVCTTCHSHSGNTTIDGNAFQGTGGCNACHAYPPAIGDGKPYRTGEMEGKGAHAQHVSHLESLWGGTLNASTDQFGSGASWTNVCGVCHDGATHNTAEAIPGNGRTIAFPAGYQFGPGAPAYNGVQGTSSGTTPKTCSNINCHFNNSPAWQDPATAGD